MRAQTIMEDASPTMVAAIDSVATVVVLLPPSELTFVVELLPPSRTAGVGFGVGATVGYGVGSGVGLGVTTVVMEEGAIIAIVLSVGSI
jgi:hypothetical protein